MKVPANVGQPRKGRYGNVSTNREYVRARPFSDWLNQKVDFYMRGDVSMEQAKALNRVLVDIGWPPTEAGARRLYRYRYCIIDGSRKGHKGPRHTEWFRREVVEDALHMAGANFYEMYPEYGSEQDIELEPAAWCPGCQEHVTPINGDCPWCDWHISLGHLNLPAAA